MTPFIPFGYFLSGMAIGMALILAVGFSQHSDNDPETTTVLIVWIAAALMVHKYLVI